MVHDDRSPTGTTSECPAKQKCFPEVPIRAKRLATSSVPAWAKSMRSQEKPSAESVRSRCCRAPASRGVTLSQRTSVRVSSITSVALVVRVSGMGRTLHPPPRKEKGAGQARPAPEYIREEDTVLLLT